MSKRSSGYLSDEACLGRVYPWGAALTLMWFAYAAYFLVRARLLLAQREARSVGARLYVLLLC